MAIFSRFTRTKPAPSPIEDDEDLKQIAQARVAPKPAPAAKPAPTAVVRPAAPVVTSPPRPVVAQPAPVLTKATPPAPRPATTSPAIATNPLLDARKAAIERLDPDDDRGAARGGFANGGANAGFNDPASSGGGMNVVGNGNRGTALAEAIGRTNNPRGGGTPVSTPVGPGGRPIETPTGTLPGADDDGVIGRPVPGTPPSSGGRPPVEEAIDSINKGRDDSESDPREDEDLAEIAAARAELAAGKAKALMMANARAQLAGMGLSGSTAALEGDIGRTQDRSAVLAMADLKRKQADEGRADRRLTAEETRADADAEFVKLQRKLAINLLEEQTGKDEDGDNLIAGETEEQRRKREALEGISLGERGADEDNVTNEDLDNAVDAGRNVGANERKAPPPGYADEAKPWVSDGTPVGFYQGEDANFYYVTGVDGKKWKVRK